MHKEPKVVLYTRMKYKKFLQLLCTKEDTNNFPFSSNRISQQFRHTLWVVSHVDEAAALTSCCVEHPVFSVLRLSMLPVREI